MTHDQLLNACATDTDHRDPAANTMIAWLFGDTGNLLRVLIIAPEPPSIADPGDYSAAMSQGVVHEAPFLRETPAAAVVLEPSEDDGTPQALDAVIWGTTHARRMAYQRARAETPIETASLPAERSIALTVLQTARHARRAALN